MEPGERGTLVGHVAELRRYPVKSMQGERLERIVLGPGGLEGDRRFAVIDTETGHSGHRDPQWSHSMLIPHRI